jgi:methyl-accepting chemotaxis protein
VITSTKEMGKVSEDSGIAIRKVLDEFVRISDGMVEVNRSMNEIRERSDEGMKAIGNVAEGMDEVRKHASETYAEMIENFKVERVKKNETCQYR